MAITGAQAQITEEVTAWQGVRVLSHRLDGVEYRLGKNREIGHIHADHQVDIPFPTAIRHAIVRMGKAQPHHALKDSGWVSFYIEQPEDIVRAIALLKRSYEIAKKQSAK